MFWCMGTGGGEAGSGDGAGQGIFQVLCRLRGRAAVLFSFRAIPQNPPSKLSETTRWGCDGASRFMEQSRYGGVHLWRPRWGLSLFQGFPGVRLSSLPPVLTGFLVGEEGAKPLLFEGGFIFFLAAAESHLLLGLVSKWAMKTGSCSFYSS